MLINNFLSLLNLRITRKKTYVELCSRSFVYADCKQQLDPLLGSPMLRRLAYSQSQMELHQDMFVLSQLEFKENGYFVEFRVAGGRALSNTYLLEKEYGWDGIVAEPAKCWHDNIRKSRSCAIETRCVWKDTGSKLAFNESSVGELSTIDSFSENDIHADFRKSGGARYEVETISLIDLLMVHKAAPVIDYLSVDTEGNEVEILSAFDVRRFQFRLITCEHNMSETREGLFDVLTSHGYERVRRDLLKCDDWYVKRSID